MSNNEQVDPGTGEVVVMPETLPMVLRRPPEQVLEEAHRAAKALMGVISKKAKRVEMNGETYLEFEDWQTVGRFYAVTARVTSTEYVTIGNAAGFLAKADVIDNHSGRIVSAAEAMCLNDEEKWSVRTKYKWVYVCKDGSLSEADPGKDQIIWEKNKKTGKMFPKKEKKAVGSEPVPMFQLRSMAQTRACAKALRNVLAWVVVLAGFKPTPAEELTGTEGDTTAPPAAIPPEQPPESTTTARTPDLDPTAPATDKQKGVINKFMANRVPEEQEWWKGVFPETLTQERAGKMIKWLGSHRPDQPLPIEDLNAMLAGGTNGK